MRLNLRQPLARRPNLCMMLPTVRTLTLKPFALISAVMLGAEAKLGSHYGLHTRLRTVLSSDTG